MSIKNLLGEEVSATPLKNSKPKSNNPWLEKQQNRFANLAFYGTVLWIIITPIMAVSAAYGIADPVRTGCSWVAYSVGLTALRVPLFKYIFYCSSS